VTVSLGILTSGVPLAGAGKFDASAIGSNRVTRPHNTTRSPAWPARFAAIVRHLRVPADDHVHERRVRLRGVLQDLADQLEPVVGQRQRAALPMPLRPRRHAGSTGTASSRSDPQFSGSSQKATKNAREGRLLRLHEKTQRSPESECQLDVAKIFQSS